MTSARIFINRMDFLNKLTILKNYDFIDPISIRGNIYISDYITDYEILFDELFIYLQKYINILPNKCVPISDKLLFIFDLINYISKNKFNRQKYIIIYDNHQCIFTKYKRNKNWSSLFDNKIIILHEIVNHNDDFQLIIKLDLLLKYIKPYYFYSIKITEYIYNYIVCGDNFIIIIDPITLTVNIINYHSYTQFIKRYITMTDLNSLCNWISNNRNTEVTVK